MESQDQATAPSLQTRRARREAALAALDSMNAGSPAQGAHGALRTPAPHSAPARPDGSVPPVASSVRVVTPISPRATPASQLAGVAAHPSLGRAGQLPVRAAAPHAPSPSVVADPAALARLAAFTEIAELRRASEGRARTRAPGPHSSMARTQSSSPQGVAPGTRAWTAEPAAYEPRPAAAVAHAPETVSPAPVALPAPSVPAPETQAAASVAEITAPVPAPPSAVPTSTHTARTHGSRRAAVEARRAAAGKKPHAAGASFQRPGGRTHRAGWVARAGILAALGVTTIAVPLANAVNEGAVTSIPLIAEGRSTLEVITTSASAAAATDAVIIAEGGTLAARDAASASRGAARDTLAGCDLSQPVRGANGRLGSEELCDLSQSGHRLQPYAAVAFDALNEAYRAKFGADICLTDSYRSLQGQYSVARSKPGLSARPGTSQHGLGLAVDLCPTSYTSTARWNWLKANGPTYGWDNPAWARSGGSGKYEPWHWEYFPLVEY